MKLPLKCTIAIMLLLPAYSATAIERLSAKELASHCNHYTHNTNSVDGEFCARYIQGFIDGAIATDARVMLNVESELSRKESFHERVMRTRSPNAHEYSRAARHAEFCLGDPVLLKEVVGIVVSDLNTKSDGIDPDKSARDLVYGSLRKNYPCK